MTKTIRAVAIAGVFVLACGDPRPPAGHFDAVPRDDAPSDDDSGGFVPPPTFPPTFGATVHQPDAPPPIAGGTLLVLSDGRVAAADADRDAVYLVDLGTRAVSRIALASHDEPGRIAEDDAGLVHVVARRGGAVVTIDPKTHAIVSRRQPCSAPRGITFDAKSRRILVACEGGEIVSLGDVAHAHPSLVARVDDDLRDIVVIGERMFVSRFRSAQVLEIDASGKVVDRRVLGTFSSASGTLAWRMIPGTEGEPLVVHQIADTEEVFPGPGGYEFMAGPTECNVGLLVMTGVTRGTRMLLLPQHVALPVDFVRDDGTYVIVAAGNGHTPELPRIYAMREDDYDCNGAVGIAAAGQPVAIALRGAHSYVVQSREPAQLELLPEHVIIPLDARSREDTGHAMFHSNAGSGHACASCHGEGGDDGHTWNFLGMGLRRTPSLRGTVEGTAPYHWDGQLADIPALADEVMTSRMGGPKLSDAQKGALASWLFAVPPPARAATSDAADRGKTLFESQATGCTGCHAGPKMTTSATVDVGTGGAFQVPSLVGVGKRAPYMHDGCAETLADRFGPCGGGDRHGRTSQLSASEIADLVAYLESL